MSKYLLFRVDSRLVHGQVCTAWIPEMLIKKVVIVHDEYSKDPDVVSLHEMVVPKGVICETISTEDALKEWQENEFGESNTLVIFQDVARAWKAYNAGIKFDEIQVATLSGNNNSVCVYKQVNVDTENARLLLSMIEKGIVPYCQMFPADARVRMEDLLNQRKYRKKLKL